MCRGKEICTELGTSPSEWDDYCPLRPPSWFDGQILIFAQAVEKLLSGQREESIALLCTLRNREMKEWCIEHGQVSGRFRKRGLNSPDESPIPETSRDPTKSPKKYQNAVFLRDGYRCRYCGSRLIAQDAIKSFASALDSEVFVKGRKASENHGIVHAAWPVADHIIPWNLGGRTTLDNLVSSCGPCNYGKYNWTIQQMGIQNPLSGDPISDDWDGLASKVHSLKMLIKT